MRRFLSILFAAWAALSAPLAQAQAPILVELFASKNCSACPKAHKTLRAVSDARDDLLVLTWSVAYWDYLGGKDPMALPESADRQRHYADRFSQRGPYTPQTVYNGALQCPGNKPAQVATALKKAGALEKTGAAMTRTRAGIELTGTTASLADVWLVSFLAGEANTTKMVNPVTGVTALTPWLGGRTLIKSPACASGCALIVQEAGFGKVLAALELTP
jgi:hypothetical protein